MRYITPNTIGTLVLVIIVMLLSKAVLNYVELPEVHINIHKECVRVLNSSSYNCENLPNKFIQYTVLN